MYAAIITISVGAMCGSGAVAEVGDAYRAMQTHRQTLVVKTRQGGKVPADPQAAKVFEGRKWAMSTRWDDSNPNALNVRKKMVESGIRGTFYLNSRKPEEQANSLAYQLTGKGECSVDGKTFVSVPHAPRYGVPAKIDETAGGASTKFPGLKALVLFDQGTGKVSCELDNATGAALSDVLLTIALPPAFEPGKLRRNRDELAQAEAWSVTAEANRSRTGTYWQGGKHYVAAQFDFILNGERGRLFTTFTEK